MIATVTSSWAAVLAVLVAIAYLCWLWLGPDGEELRVDDRWFDEQQRRKRTTT